VPGWRDASLPGLLLRIVAFTFICRLPSMGRLIPFRSSVPLDLFVLPTSSGAADFFFLII
jgi:hypothetical protein